jgi:hypothetical protein
VIDWDGKFELLTIDPGQRKGRANLGWALFANDRLVEADVESSSENAMPPGCYPFSTEQNPRFAIIEAPRWYPREHRIDTNDLLDLSVLVGELKRHFAERGANVELVYPRTWKGTVPKDIHNKRVLAALSKEELAVLPKRPRAKDYDHNVLDAVGLGLWKLGRMR